MGDRESRLQAWEEEKRTNKYKLAHLADRAIRLIKAEATTNAQPRDEEQ